MKLSVIIPCFNAADFIAVQLESLARQHWSQPWEVIVSDNGSTDESLKIVDNYRDRLPNLRVTDSSDRRGSAHARNVGAQNALGDALAFCDADDEVGPGWIASMGKALSEFDFVAGRLEPNKLNEAWVVKTRKSNPKERLPVYSYSPYLPHAATGNMGIKRSLHEAVGGFDETWEVLEETDYCFKLQLLGHKLHFVPEAIVYYRYRNTLSGIYKQACSYAQGNVRLRKKYRSPDIRIVSWKSAAKSWFRLLCSLPKQRQKADFGRWTWELGNHIGRLKGSIKYRVIDL
jgi:glycosyltransferase involved in cell wall biosynthesis